MDPFKSTVFYPTPKVESAQNVSQPSPMNQCILSGLPVFARDTGKDAKKAYMACGYEHFCFTLYAKATDRTRHMYELLQMDKPTKIYLDFDHSDVTAKEYFIDSSNKFIKATLCAIEELSDKKSDDIPFYVLEASTDKKLSRHVIFECFLKDIDVVRAFVEYVANQKCACEYLDKRVYTRNRLFRLIYSYKFGKDPSSALTVSGSHEYNPFHVFKTMIQAKLPPHYTGPFEKLKEELAQGTTFVNLKSMTSSSGNGYIGNSVSKRNIPPGLHDFVAAFSDEGAVLSCKENDDFISCIIGGKKCPWTQSVHKSNNQYFTICKKTMRGFFQCADQECADSEHGMVPYGHVDLTFLWRQEMLNL